LNNSDIIAAASLVIATLAFFTTAWQTWVTHRHSQLSVKPLLNWATHRTLTPKGYEVRVVLSNAGLGPAVIHARHFTLDGSKYKSQSDKETDAEALVGKLLPKDWNCSLVAQGLPGIGSAILPNNHQLIAHLVFDPFVYDYSSHLDKLMERVQFIVEYGDLYGNRYVYSTNQDSGA
jgi:hypothetical protein